jgi:hypothetical protein
MTRLAIFRSHLVHVSNRYHPTISEVRFAVPAGGGRPKEFCARTDGGMAANGRQLSNRLDALSQFVSNSENNSTILAHQCAIRCLPTLRWTQCTSLG